MARPLPARSSAARPIPTRGRAADALAAGRAPVVKKPRPDPGPLRIAIGLTGVAAASALVSAFLAPSVGGTTTTQTTVVAVPAQPVQHITRYVQLAPGQTPPPQAVIQQAPAPKPRVVIVTTKQSGK
jgi:hypothetical protein